MCAPMKGGGICQGEGGWCTLALVLVERYLGVGATPWVWGGGVGYCEMVHRIRVLNEIWEQTLFAF